jgi:hypothetical protein
MGRKLSIDEHASVLAWAEAFKSLRPFEILPPVGACIRREARRELDLYWNLANLSRAGERRPGLSASAYKSVFRVRVTLERGLAGLLGEHLDHGRLELENLFDGDFFGCSIKQGASLRMPLASCAPTADCRGSCYAHDGMDAGRNPVVKGVLNGAIAAHFEAGEGATRTRILDLLRPHVRRAARAAQSEAAAAGFSRRARIRFSHVGEIAAFPAFANKLAALVRDESKGEVDCVVYTRHPNAGLLDPALFLVLFSLDESSEDRRRFVPQTARVVRSAFGGRISDSVDVNFLEHHRWEHIKPVGTGKVCPATAPETKNRTCDGCKCDFCFTPKLATLGASQ